MRKLFVATESFNGIKLDAVASIEGIRHIFINRYKLPGNFLNIENVDGNDPSMFNLFVQLDEYFNKSRKEFDLRLEVIGTNFQKKVWGELNKIEYGITITYQELAIRLGDLKLIRAAGRANGVNPLPIVIPCHRVIGSSGKLVGYGGGLEVKKKLLELEGSINPSLFD